MLPTISHANSNLPQADQLWKKVKQDLAKGFKIHGTHPHFQEVVRVYTKHPIHEWQFLIIASANQTNPPVFSLELNAYPPGVSTWRLILQHKPIPAPRWEFHWQSLENSYPLKDMPTQDKQSEIITAYLESEIDIPATKAAYARIGGDEMKTSWMNQSV